MMLQEGVWKRARRLRRRRNQYHLWMTKNLCLRRHLLLQRHPHRQ
jgi:hypothetical protein